MLLNKASTEPAKVTSAPNEEPTPVLTLPLPFLLAWLVDFDPVTTVVFPDESVPVLVVVSSIETPAFLVLSFFL